MVNNFSASCRPVLFVCLTAVWAITAGPAPAQEAGGAAPGASRALRLPAATVVDAAMKTVTRTVPINGSLVARETVAVTPQVTGYQITDVRADVGDKVKAGDVLATLDRKPLQSALDEAEAALQAADAASKQAQSQIAAQEAAYSQAQTVLSRAQRLVKSGAGAQSTLDDAVATTATAEANLKAAQDQLASVRAQAEQAKARRADAELQLQRTSVVAPVDGIVSSRNADIGQTAMGGGDTLFTLIRNGEIEFDGTIIETAIPEVRIGQAATIDPAGLDPRDGHVRLISPRVDPTTRLGSIKISIENDNGLSIGIYAKAVVETARREAVTVPLSAVIPAVGGSTVQVVGDDGTIHVTKVETGIVNGDVIEILNGIPVGATVVAKSGPFFRDGMRIKPIRGTPNAPDADIPVAANASYASSQGTDASAAEPDQ